MKILYLTDSYRPSRSACANRAAVLVEALRKAGHDVQVLASSDSLIGSSGKWEKPDYLTFFETYPLVKKTFVNRLRNNFGGQRSSIQAARFMGEFDVVICTTPPLLLLTSAIRISKMKKAKLVWDVRDVWPDVAYEMGSFSPGSPYGRFFSHVAGQGYKAADLITTVSEGKADKLRSRVLFSHRQQVALIPNGIDESFIGLSEDSSLIESLGLDGGTPKCVYVGNIGLAQGLGTLLDIAAAHSSVRFLIFGEGADRERLEERVLQEGIGNVEFCGTVDASGVRTALSYAALSYVPLVSSKLRDSIPTKLYEAFACGCPVVLAAAPDGDAAALLASCGIGECAAPEDDSGLAKAFGRALMGEYSSEERDAMRRAVVMRHSRQMFAHEFVRVVEKLGGDR